ncbi:MAG: hypothetical protein JO149_00830 [Gammaproteobacteria bacterium]|nr:hypothetical protein [Gammaproteobacteria bacterium]
MVDKKPSMWNKLLKSVFIIIPGLINILHHLKILIGHELQYVFKNMTVLIFLSVLLSMMLAVTWCSLLAFFYLCLTSLLKLSALISTFILLLLNIIMLLFITLFISKTKNKLCDFCYKYFQ